MPLWRDCARITEYMELIVGLISISGWEIRSTASILRTIDVNGEERKERTGSLGLCATQ
jgi:hypothetical protein